MTVEIAVMNLEAVALASDSALTVYTGGNTKIFGSQNKLFALSTIAPVGILVYGNGTFMSIPWETLIKEYRHKQQHIVFPKLHDYIEDFCQFLSEDISKYISPEQQSDYAEDLVRIIYEEIAHVIQQRFMAAMDQPPAEVMATDAGEVSGLIDSITREVVDHYSQLARDATLVEGAPDGFLGEIRKTMRAKRPKIRDAVFQRKLDQGVVRKLNTIADKAIGAMLDDMSMQQSRLTTGIVVAGFGDNDLFPSFSEIHIEGLVLGVLKKRTGRRGGTGPDSRAAIVPFAQTDMIYQFMQGIAPDYGEYLHDFIVSHFNSYAELVLDNLGEFFETEKDDLLEQLYDVHPEIADSFLKQVEDIGRYYYASEILDVVAMLPKEQLGTMAEALVNLTSLKRMVSLEDETVGGPTDLILITKGDGLVWIKRKYYFPADLNPAFFSRKYGTGGTHDVTENPHGQND